MSTKLASQALYALIVSVLSTVSASAAVTGLTAGASEPSIDTRRQHALAPAGENARRDPGTRDDRVKSSKAAAGSSAAARNPVNRGFATRNAGPANAIHGAGLVHRSLSPLPDASATMVKPRGGATTAAGPTERKPAITSSAVRAPTAVLKAVAGAAVIGAPRIPSRGSTAGPTIGRTPLKAGIDGTALRRRF